MILFEKLNIAGLVEEPDLVIGAIGTNYKGITRNIVDEEVAIKSTFIPFSGFFFWFISIDVFNHYMKQSGFYIDVFR